ncbi:WbuC family cupin fold metalloprotein [Escherichia coli]
MFIVMQGQLQVCLHGKDGEVVKQFIVGENTEINIVEFSPETYTVSKCLSPRALMMEVKEGPFDPSFAKAFV